MRRARCLLILVALVATACSGGAQPQPSATAKPNQKPSPKPVVPSDPIEAAVGDIQDFWAARYPDAYHEDYDPVPPDRVFAAGQERVVIPTCSGHIVDPREWANNAFYCFRDNFIVYDARPSGLITQLRQHFGEVAVSAVLAHEWGHAIQDRSETMGRSIYMELQADCFSGAWVGHVAADHPAAIPLHPGDLDHALAAILSFRDAPGSSARAPWAHGSGFDRISAFEDGYQNGIDSCVQYFDDPPLVTEQSFSSYAELRTGGNAREGIVLPASIEMLNYFYSAVAQPDFSPLDKASVLIFDPASPPNPMPTCDGTTLTVADLINEVYQCLPDGYIIVDKDYLHHVYTEIGDFGVTTLLAEPWAAYTLELQGVDGAGTDVTARAADCYTGGFAAALVNGRLKSKIFGGKVEASPGDLDEAVLAFVDADQVHGASADQGDAVFARFGAFRSGFLNGYESCDPAALSASPAPSGTPSASSSASPSAGSSPSSGVSSSPTPSVTP